MGCFHILWYVIVGFCAGFVARIFVHGGGHMGFIYTTILGIIGSLIGGVIAGLIWKPADSRFHPAGFVFSVIGAIIALWFWVHYGSRFIH